jgi:hypothetical protein
MMPGTKAFSLLLTAMLLSGCASIAKGVTEAILENSEEQDTRACHIEGPASVGLEPLMQAQEKERTASHSTRTVKVLMVHGIGRHLPGYSARLTEHLMRELKLDVREEDYKEFVLRDPKIRDGPLGNLRISRHMNKARTRELLFYELTWSEIIDPEREILAFDDSTEYTFRRTALNAGLKKFFNSHVPDSLIFLGEAQVPILASVRQSFCWMTHGDWNDYAPHTDASCNLQSGERLQQLEEDSYAFITHSLGSRIVIEALQIFGEWAQTQETEEFIKIRSIMSNKEFPVYMLANQLPLLELGRKPATVRGQIDQYCRPDGDLRDQRILGKLPIYAFSDPNDLLSYPIPPNFADQYLDSRLCPKVTNIAINVAKLISLFGLGEFARPGSAHGDYDHDERVIAMIAHGFGQEKAADIVKERCTWLETVDE